MNNTREMYVFSKVANDSHPGNAFHDKVFLGISSDGKNIKAWPCVIMSNGILHPNHKKPLLVSEIVNGKGHEETVDVIAKRQLSHFKESVYYKKISHQELEILIANSKNVYSNLTN